MLTVLRVKLALLPLALILVGVAAGHLAAGAVAAAAASAVLIASGWRNGLTQVDVAVSAICAGTLPAVLLGYAGPVGVIAGAHAVLAAMSFISVARGRPWTAEFSRRSHAAAAQTPTFLVVNRALSLLWGVLFALLAGLLVIGVPNLVTTLVVAIGIAASVFGPRLAMRHYVGKLLNSEPHDWPAPAVLAKARGDDVDVAVVGAGLGGLTAAALLAEAGARVLVTEQHVVAGGFAHNWLRQTSRDGRKLIFRFDAGVHDVSGTYAGGPVESLLRRLDAPAIDWLPLDRRHLFEGRTLDVSRDAGAYTAQLAALFPDEQDAIHALFADIRAILDAMYNSAHANSGVPCGPRTIEEMLAFPARFPLAVQWMERPFLELVRSHVRNPELERILFALGGYISDDGVNAPVKRMAPIFGYLFHGGTYPRGGSGVIADALVDVIVRHGGTVRLNSRVRRILIERGAAAGLSLDDGTTIRAPAVIANADLKRTLLDLVGEDHLPSRDRARLTVRRPSCSAFAVHLGLEGRLDLPPLVHIHAGARSVGLVAPSVVDPSAAPTGYSTVELVRLVSNEDARAWFGPAHADLDEVRQSPEYKSRKRAVADEMIAVAEAAIPDLRQRIVVQNASSPVTFQRYDLSSDGAIYGLDGFASEPFKTPVAGLAIAGSANLGAGVEAVMIAGARAAEVFVPGLLASRPTASLRPGTAHTAVPATALASP